MKFRKIFRKIYFWAYFKSLIIHLYIPFQFFVYNIFFLNWNFILEKIVSCFKISFYVIVKCPKYLNILRRLFFSKMLFNCHFFYFNHLVTLSNSYQTFCNKLKYTLLVLNWFFSTTTNYYHLITDIIIILLRTIL